MGKQYHTFARYQDKNLCESGFSNRKLSLSLLFENKLSGDLTGIDSLPFRQKNENEAV